MPTQPPRTASSAGAARPAFVDAVVVAIAAAIASIMCLPNTFTLDDVPIIANAPRLHGLAHWREIIAAPYWTPPFVPDLYRPLTLLALAAQYALGDGAALVFRVVSVLLYLALCFLVWRLATRLLSRRAALVLGVLFAVHPVHVEAVATAVGQSELIVAMLSVWAVDRYLRIRRGGDELAPDDWMATGLAYAAACFAKENGFVLPGFLIAAELTLFADARIVERVKASWRGFTGLAVVGASCLAIRTAILHGQVGAAAPPETFVGVGTGRRLLTALRVVPEWLRLFVWPAHLRIEYDPPDFAASTGFHSLEALGALLLLIAVVAFWQTRKRLPVVAFGLACAAVALLPVSNLLVTSVGVLAERTLLLPSVWFLFVVVTAVAWVAEREAVRALPTSRALAAVVASLVVLGTARSIERHRTWKDQNSLMTASVRDDPRNWRVWQGYARVLYANQRMDDAFTAWETAIALSSNKAGVRNEYAAALHDAGRDTAAEAQLRISLAEQPRQIVGVAALPAVLIALGKYAEARNIADSVIAVENAPPVMVFFRKTADSALKANAPAESVRLPLPLR